VPNKKSNIEKVYYSIGEVAEMIDVTPSSIRYWENSFKELAPRTNAKGTRYFTKEDIDTVKLINYLVKERGLTIKGAQQKLTDNKAETVNNWEIVRRLQEIKEELTGILDEMEEKSPSQSPTGGEVGKEKSPSQSPQRGEVKKEETEIKNDD
jgi:DNA-binding transcriptional MerR regulator